MWGRERESKCFQAGDKQKETPLFHLHIKFSDVFMHEKQKYSWGFKKASSQSSLQPFPNFWAHHSFSIQNTVIVHTRQQAYISQPSALSLAIVPGLQRSLQTHLQPQSDWFPPGHFCGTPCFSDWHLVDAKVNDVSKQAWEVRGQVLPLL